MQALLGLFLTFFKLGAFTFGGGYAMISLIENEVVTKKGWLTRDEMLDIITIAESTPGPLAINMATFVGTKIKGILGAIVSTVGLVLPPFTIICIISLVLNEFKEIAVIAYALKGIQAGVVVLILNAFLKFFKGMDKSIMSYIFLVVTFLIALLTSFPVVAIIVIGGVLGVSITMISTHIAKKKVTAVENGDANNNGENADISQLAGGISEENADISLDVIEKCDAENTSISDENTCDNEDDIGSDMAENKCENNENITFSDIDAIIDADKSHYPEDTCVSLEETNTQNSDTYTIVSETCDEEDSDI